MKFTQELTTANVVKSLEPNGIRVGERLLAGNVILSATEIIEPWEVAAPPLVQLADLAPVLALKPEVIILGTGGSICFPPPDLVGQLARQGIGIEVMDTAAACRTYNVLVHEERAVAAALLNGSA